VARNLQFLALCLVAATHAGGAGQTTASSPARIVTAYALSSCLDAETYDPAAWRLLASNDGQSWTLLDLRTNQYFSARCQRRVFLITNETAFNTYRLQVDQNRAGSLRVLLGELELIGPITGVTNEADLQQIISASREHPLLGLGENAFDHDPATKWLDFGLSEPGGCWLQCRYTLHAEHVITNVSELRIHARRAATQNLLLDKAPEIVSNLAAYATKPLQAISGYALTSANDAPERDPRDWRLLGSNDGGKRWETLDIRRNEVFATRFQRHTYALAHQAAYAIYRLQIDAIASATESVVCQLGELEPLYHGKDADTRFSLIVSADSENPPMESVDRAFDGEARTKWLAFSYASTNQSDWLQWQFVPRVDGLPVIDLLQLNRLLAEPTPQSSTETPPDPLAQAAKPVRTLIGYALTSANDFSSRDPRDWRLQGSPDNGRSWNTLDARRNEFFTQRLQRRDFRLPKPASYPLYRLCIDCVAKPGTVTNGANSVQLAELEPVYSPRDTKQKLSLVVSAQGENPPRETAAMAFDGNPATKWLDFCGDDTNRASWIEWSYSAAETRPVIRQDLARSLRPRTQVTRVQLEGVLAWIDAGSKRVGFLDKSGFQIFDLDTAVAGVAPGDRVRLTGRLQFEHSPPKLLDPQLISLGRLTSGPEVGKQKLFPEHQDFFFGAVEGRVTGVSQDDFFQTIQVALTKGSGQVQVNLLDSTRNFATSLTNSQIRAEGVVEPVYNEQGQRVPGAVWVASWNNLTLSPVLENKGELAASPDTAPIDEKHPVTRISRIYDLAHSQTTNGFPIKVRGVITYIDLGLGEFYLQNGADSILVQDQMSAGLSPFLHQEGDYVELHATAYPGSPPDIYPSGFVTVLGKGRMPTPLRRSWNYLMTGKDDGRWVEVDGLVAAVEEQRLALTLNGGQLIAWVNELDKTLQNRLLGSWVRIAGVCSPVLNQRNQRLGVRLLVPGSRNIQMVKAAPDDPFQLQSVAITNVMSLDAEDSEPSSQLVKITGVVTHKGPQSFFLQDGVDGMRVFPRKDSAFGPGDRVEAVGLPEPDGLSPKLVQALVRKVGTAPMPPAVARVTPGSADVSQDATRVQMEATLLGSSLRDSFQVLELRSENTARIFHAFLPIGKDPFPVLPAGSRLRLEGVYKATTDTAPDFGQVISSFEIYLNSPADITVLERPPWWTARHTLWLLTGLGAVVLVSLAWVGSLRRQVRQRTRDLHEEIAERKQAAAELAHERELLRTLLDGSPDQIYFKDEQSRFIRCSKSQAERFNIHPDEIHGKTDFDFFTEDHARPAFEDEQEILRTGRPLIGKVEREVWKSGKGASWVLTSKMPLRNQEGRIIGTFGISKDITAIKDAEARLEEVHRELLQTSRMAGMAEVATSVLHNVGNVLNSVNISSSVIGVKLKKSKVSNLSKVAALFEEHADDLPGFFASNPKGGQLPGYISTLAVHLAAEQEELLQEIDSLARNIDHIKEIVAMQQNYAKVLGVLEPLPVAELVEDALRLNAGAMQRHQVRVIRDYADLPPAMVDKHKILQILVNLIRNAKYALDDGMPPEKQLTLQIRLNDGKVRISVKDNGIGIPPENLTRIFAHGFTTRKDGHGFGLHSGALAAREMGGSLTVQSEGPGKGATFTLEFPSQPREESETPKTKRQAPEKSQVSSSKPSDSQG